MFTQGFADIQARQLTQEEVELIYKVKGLASQVQALIVHMKRHPASGSADDSIGTIPRPNTAAGTQPSLDHRWVNIGQTHLQEGFAALVRAVAQPPGL